VLNALRGSPLNSLTGNINEVTMTYHIFYNLFIPIILSMTACAVLVFTRFRVYCFFYLALFAQAGVTFATAPAAYFMYYQPLFTCGIAFTVIGVLLFVARRKQALPLDDAA
jgi:hypothetical protein